MKYIKCISLILILFLLAMGCSGSYGKIRTQAGTDKKMTLSELRENWKDYHIYYGTRGDQTPAGIMFDPKNDDTRLVGDSWFKIADQQALSETMEIIETVWGGGEVALIEGPDGRFFGYMYYPWKGSSYGRAEISLEMVDEKTLYVGSMPWCC